MPYPQAQNFWVSRLEKPRPRASVAYETAETSQPLSATWGGFYQKQHMWPRRINQYRMWDLGSQKPIKMTNVTNHYFQSNNQRAPSVNHQPGTHARDKELTSGRVKMRLDVGSHLFQWMERGWQVCADRKRQNSGEWAIRQVKGNQPGRASPCYLPVLLPSLLPFQQSTKIAEYLHQRNSTWVTLGVQYYPSTTILVYMHPHLLLLQQPAMAGDPWPQGQSSAAYMSM